MEKRQTYLSAKICIIRLQFFKVFEPLHDNKQTKQDSD